MRAPGRGRNRACAWSGWSAMENQMNGLTMDRLWRWSPCNGRLTPPPPPLLKFRRVLSTSCNWRWNWWNLRIYRPYIDPVLPHHPRPTTPSFFFAHCPIDLIGRFQPCARSGKIPVSTLRPSFPSSVALSCCCCCWFCGRHNRPLDWLNGFHWLRLIHRSKGEGRGAEIAWRDEQRIIVFAHSITRPICVEHVWRMCSCSVTHFARFEAIVLMLTEKIANKCYPYIGHTTRWPVFSGIRSKFFMNSFVILYASFILFPQSSPAASNDPELSG